MKEVMQCVRMTLQVVMQSAVMTSHVVNVRTMRAGVVESSAMMRAKS